MTCVSDAGFATYSQLSSTVSLVFTVISGGLTLTTGGSIYRKCKKAREWFYVTFVWTYFLVVVDFVVFVCVQLTQNF